MSQKSKIKKNEVIQNDELEEVVEGVNWIVVGPLLAVMVVTFIAAFIMVI